MKSLYEVYKLPCAESGCIDIQHKAFVIVDFFFFLTLMYLSFSLGKSDSR